MLLTGTPGDSTLCGHGRSTPILICSTVPHPYAELHQPLLRACQMHVVVVSLLRSDKSPLPVEQQSGLASLQKCMFDRQACCSLCIEHADFVAVSGYHSQPGCRLLCWSSGRQNVAILSYWP